MAEDLTQYMSEIGIRVKYLHSDIDTLERAEITRDLRLDVFDVLVGINLLREGLDIPEITLVAILDADKEGFLRSETSLIQTIGRAARNSEGHVIMYADKITDSMRVAIDETERRRKIQQEYNEEHGITPTTIQKSVRDLIAISKKVAAEEMEFTKDPESMSRKELEKLIADIQKKMQKAAAQEGLNIYISSGYRSYDYQVKVYNSMVKAYGKKYADEVSARPGYSEHQTGLVFDLNSIDLSFAQTKESKWVDAHAHEYGFIIRYPEGKDAITGYSYEPWHLRYLGVENATKVYNSGLTLEEYLGITSKYPD